MSRFERIHGKTKNKKQLSTEEEIFGNKKENKKRKFKKIIKIIFIFIVIITSLLLYAILSSGLIQDPTGLIKIKDQFNNGKVNILILGSDIRPNEIQSRSDSIIVASFDFKNETGSLLSIPRDTKVEIPGYGEDKINHAYAFGGLELSQKTIENFTNIKIDRSVEINFESFKSIINKLGGIEIDVEEKMYYIEEGIDLNPGKQILNGEDALSYVRFRGTPTGDFGRIQRQQKFISSLLHTIKTKANLFQQISTLTSLLKCIKTNISLQESIYMFSRYKDSKEFKIFTWTSSGNPEMIQGISYMIPSNDAIKENYKFLTGDLVSINDFNDYDKKKLVTPEEKILIEQNISLNKK